MLIRFVSYSICLARSWQYMTCTSKVFRNITLQYCNVHLIRIWTYREFPTTRLVDYISTLVTFNQMKSLLYCITYDSLKNVRLLNTLYDQWSYIIVVMHALRNDKIHLLCHRYFTNRWHGLIEIGIQSSLFNPHYCSSP